jgi:hypothetical protein
LISTNAGGIVCYRGFHIGYVWSICSILNLAEMLVIMSVLGELGLRIPGTLGDYLLAALLQVRILVTLTIIILLFGRAVLDLMVCVITIKAKVVDSLISSNFLF